MSFRSIAVFSVLVLSLSYQACIGKNAQVVKNFVKAGLVGLLKLKNNATNQEITLLGEVHHDPNNLLVQEKEAKQFSVVQNYLVNQEKHHAKNDTHVLIEQPFEVVGAERTALSPARSLVSQEFNPIFTKTTFENAEERKYSGGGFLTFNKNFTYFDTVKRIAIGGVEYLVDSLKIKDILNERMNLKRHVEDRKNVFVPGQESWVNHAIKKSEEANVAFEKTINALGHSDTSSVLDVAISADKRAFDKNLTINESFSLEQQKNVRPSLSLMLSHMIDPVYELYLYSRIASDPKKDHIVLTGASHAAALRFMLEKNNFKMQHSAGSIKAGTQPMLDEYALKKALS